MKKHTLTIIVALLCIIGANTVNAQSDPAKLNWVIQMYDIVPDTPEMAHRMGRYEAQRKYLALFPPNDSTEIDFEPVQIKAGIDRYRITPRLKHKVDIETLNNLIAISDAILDSLPKAPRDYYRYKDGKIAVLKHAMGYNIKISNPYMEWIYDPSSQQIPWVNIQIPNGYHEPRSKGYITPSYYWQMEFSKLVDAFRKNVSDKHAFTWDGDHF